MGTCSDLNCLSKTWPCWHLFPWLKGQWWFLAVMNCDRGWRYKYTVYERFTLMSPLRIFLMHLSLSYPTYPRSGMGGNYWGFARVVTISLPLGAINIILCCKSPTFCIGIAKTMKILGQMRQPSGQIMLTNHYESPPIAWPGVCGDWQW